MIKLIVEDYTVAVVNPHLSGLVRDIDSRLMKSKKRISVRVTLDPEDHARTTHGRPDELDLETLTGMIVDSLTRSRFGFTCKMSFLPVAAPQAPAASPASTTPPDAT